MSLSDAHPRITILKELSREPGAYLSGGRLADMLGVSRVTVWKYFEQLRDEGFEFEAVRKKGYRLIKTPIPAHEDWLKAILAVKATTNLSIQVLDSTDSTNSEAERWLSQGKETPHFIIARAQTAGRGRQGNTWRSADSSNLFMTAVFRPELLPSQMQLFTLWVGLHVARALRRFNERICIKWPNDLWIDSKKCAGMLTEARIDADRTRDLVFGLGLNINAAPQGEGLLSSKLIDGAEKVPVSIIAAAVIQVILKAYETVSAENTADRLQSMWPAYDLLQNAEVEMKLGAQEISGIARGIREDGALQVELPNGTVRSLQSGDVQKVRPRI